jgi:glutamine amidotransferase-like uncharacterized protein
MAVALDSRHAPPAVKADIAIYSDNGVWSDSVTAATKMFQWMGYAVKLVDSSYLNDQGLVGFKVFVVPGGDMYQYSSDLSAKAKDEIRSFVRGGGGYIGICGGAYFASERVSWRGSELSMTPLGLFAGAAEGPIDSIMPYPDYTMASIRMANSTLAVTLSGNGSMSMLYYWGPALIPDDDASVEVLGRYSITDQPAIVAFNCGQGRVLLVGAHPEIEEGDARDGVAFGDELSDPESEWDLMRNVVLWMVG